MALGCGHKPAVAPTPPGGGPPPVWIAASYPGARSIAVFTDTDIWVQFVSPLDTNTANDRSVFFKSDTRRLPASLTYEAATRRLHIAPRDPLALRKTYTVELAGSIQFTTGGELGQTYSWQFTTISLRRPASPLPPDGRRKESPFAALRWGGITEAGVGAVVFEVHASSDSAAAADPAGPSFGVQSSPLYVPRVKWRQDGPQFWAVHARNLETGERLVGPVWRFETLPADAPYDSVVVSVNDWDWVDVSAPARQRCMEDSLSMRTGAITSTIRWNFSPVDTSVRLADAGIELTPRYAAHVAVTGPSVWAANSVWSRCQQGWNGPPNTDEANGKLADAVVVSPTRILFSSDALSAHIEATWRNGGLYGYLFRCPFRRSYFGPGAGSPTVRATLWVKLYRITP